MVLQQLTQPLHLRGRLHNTNICSQLHSSILASSRLYIALTLPSSILSGVSFNLFETSTSFRLILPGEKSSVIICRKNSHKLIPATSRL